jgi:hypothetical protein
MSDAKYTITLDFKGRDELEKIIAEIGKKHNIPVDIDISTAKLGVLQNVNKSFKDLANTVRMFTTHAGLAISGVQQIYAAFDKVIGTFIRAAQEQESAQTLLQGALRATGLEVDKNTQKLSAYASEMQKATIYGDEMLMTSMAEMQNIARFDSTETLMRATKAAIGLSAAFGLDLTTAMDLVGKAAAGNTAMLGRYGIVLEEAASKAEKLNQVIALGENYFGIAEEKAKTSAGKVEQLKNAWGDLQEVMAGGVLPVLSGAVDILKPLIESLSGSTTGLEAQKKAIVGQRVEFERLVSVYKELHFNQNRSNEENAKYKRTIGELMSKYSNYLKNINLEKDAWGDIEVAIGSARSQMQAWINLSIRKAIIEDQKDDLVKVTKKHAEKVLELEVLRAEFDAGLKHRTQMVPGVNNPLGGSAQGVNYVEAPSGDAKREMRLVNAVAQYQKDIDALNKQIERRIALIEGMTAVEPSANEPKGKGKGKETGTAGSANEQDSLLKRLDDFRILQEAAFQEEEAAKKRRERQYQDDLKLLGANEAQKGLLKKEYDKDVAEIEDKYRKEREDRERQHYEELKFYDSGYYEWKKNQIESAGKQSFPNKPDDRQAWIDAQLAELEKEQSAWDNKAIVDFESQYETEMGHLSELQQLGLVTYAEIAKAAWEYYNALKAIVEVDGEVSAAEQEMLEKYLKRAEKAQLAANRDPDDVVSYYEQVKFLDSSYFEWKKKRIEDEVKLMEISADQKDKILKKLLDDLAEEEKASKPNKTMFDYGLDILGVPEGSRQGIKDSYQQMANQIAGIWSQMYANLDSQKNSALKKLEARAKNERKSEAWLAAEKEKINEQYEKKTRAMKRTEQKMQIASGLMNTFEGVTNALTVKPAWLAPIMAASIGALGLANVGYIAAQKFAQGGSPRGLFRGAGSTTSDSNLIAISDQEYIIAADRVRKFGVSFFDALNFGNIEHVRNAIASIKFPAHPTYAVTPKSSYNEGGVAFQPKSSQSQTLQVSLICDSRELAKAVTRGNKKTIRIN